MIARTITEQEQKNQFLGLGKAETGFKMFQDECCEWTFHIERGCDAQM